MEYDSEIIKNYKHYNNVLILVLVEHDSGGNTQIIVESNVLILVLVEHDSPILIIIAIILNVLILVLVEHDSVLLISGCQ